MRWSSLLLLFVLFTTSCKTYKGDVDIHEDITVFKKIKKGKGSKKVTFVPGKYSGTLRPSSRTKFKLILKDEKGKSHKIPFLIEKGTKFPKKNGELLIKKETSKQPYDLAIKVSTDVSTSGEYTTTESCVSHYIHDEVCRWVPSRNVCHTEGGNRVCRTKPSGQEVCYTTSSRQVCHSEPGYNDCRTESIPVYGSEEVTYADVTTVFNIVINLVDAETIKGVFDHAKSKTKKKPIASGPCN